jgi:hypothetical protein
MEQPKKEIRRYNSKYSGKTAEEILEIKKEQQRAWVNRMSEEERKKMRDKYNDEHNKEWKKYRSGRCEICDREYSDLKNHCKTKKHSVNMQKKAI